MPKEAFYMKKTLSVVLAVLMAVLCFVPAFAEGEHSVTFVRASEAFRDENLGDAYYFVLSTNGEISYDVDDEKTVHDPGAYVLYQGRYILYADIVMGFEQFENAPAYFPVKAEGTISIPEGQNTLSFKVITNSKYNAGTVTVIVNGDRENPLIRDSKGEYHVSADRDLEISVAEYTSNNEPALQRNHYNINLTSGEGYKVKTCIGQTTKAVYYGDSFDFRVKIGKGYTGSNMKVYLQRGEDDLEQLIGEEANTLSNLMGANEVLTSNGVDAEGCRTYHIDNITTDCKIMVDGVKEESQSGILAKLKRILRLILHALGINISFLEDMVASYNVNITNNLAASGVYYQLTTPGEDGKVTAASLQVMSGEGVALKIVKPSEDTPVTVVWTPGNEDGTAYRIGSYECEFSKVTGEYTWTATYYIDNITADTTITIR